MRNRIQGFSLLELSFVLAILGVMLQGYFTWKQAHIETLKVERTIEGIAVIDEALYSFYINRGHWPTNMASLSLFSNHTTFTNAFGLPFTVQATPAQPFAAIVTTFNSSRHRNEVLAAFRASGTAVGDKGLRVVVPIPGSESAHSQLVSRSGGQASSMKGNLVMGGNDVEGVAGITLTEVNRMGHRCTGNRLTRGVKSRLVICADGFWRNVSPATVVQHTAGYVSIYPPLGFDEDDCVAHVIHPLPVRNPHRNPPPANSATAAGAGVLRGAGGSIDSFIRPTQAGIICTGPDHSDVAWAIMRSIYGPAN